MTEFEHYRDYNYINALIFNNLNKIPEGIDTIVGIPRSGMITATMVGEYRNCAVTDIFSFVNDTNSVFLNNFYSNSKQYKGGGRRILLVDDSMGMGVTMKNAVEFIKTAKPDVEITTYVVFVEPYSVDKVDIYCEVFERQYMPYSILKRGVGSACVDMDGVLTENVPPEYDTDDEKYEWFLSQQRPLFIPDTRVCHIVTSRLYKYKDVTEKWLISHGIRYGNLTMLNVKDMNEKAGIDSGAYKAYVYGKSECQLFIESCLREAVTIKTITGKPVFCTETCSMV